jgi:hypothetical protein
VAIQYRGTGTSGNSGGTAATTVTATLPTGWAAGDLLFFTVRIGSSAVTGFSQTGGTGTWTIDFSAANSTGSYYKAVAHRLMAAGDTAPTFTWTTSSTTCTSCGGFFSDAGWALSLEGFAAGDPVENGTAGTSVTPNAITAAGPGRASVIITDARASASGSPVSHTYTPPSGWTWNDGDGSFFAGGANARFSAHCYQLGVSGTVTPGSQSLTDSTSDTFFFSVFHALVAESQLGGPPVPQPPGRIRPLSPNPRAPLPGMPGGTPFQLWPPNPGPAPALQAQAGPPVYPLGHPVQARQPLGRGGTVTSRDGTFAQAGPPVRPPDGPVRAQPAVPFLKGRISSRAGLYAGAGPPVRPHSGPAQAARPPVSLRSGRATGRDGTYAGTGPPVRPPDGPVRVLPTLPPRGRIQGRAGTFTAAVPQAGPPIYPLGHPVQARQLPQRGGRAASRAGTFTAGVPQAGPPVYPLGHPVRTRPQPPPRGRIVKAAGTYAGTGPPVRPAQGPVGVSRRQPPPPTRGRTASQRGPYGQTGPPVVRLRRPVRGQPARPLLTGRATWRAGVYTAPFVVPFTVGALTASTAPGATLTAFGDPAGVMTASAATGALTASTAAAGADSYPDIYYSDIYPAAPAATLTATDQRTGGPG